MQCKLNAVETRERERRNDAGKERETETETQTLRERGNSGNLSFKGGNCLKY